MPEHIERFWNGFIVGIVLSLCFLPLFPSLPAPQWSYVRKLNNLDFLFPFWRQLMLGEGDHSTNQEVASLKTEPSPSRQSHGFLEGNGNDLKFTWRYVLCTLNFWWKKEECLLLQLRVQMLGWGTQLDPLGNPFRSFWSLWKHLGTLSCTLNSKNKGKKNYNNVRLTFHTFITPFKPLCYMM